MHVDNDSSMIACNLLCISKFIFNKLPILYQSLRLKYPTLRLYEQNTALSSPFYCCDAPGIFIVTDVPSFVVCTLISIPLAVIPIPPPPPL